MKKAPMNIEQGADSCKPLLHHSLFICSLFISSFFLVSLLQHVQNQKPFPAAIICIYSTELIGADCRLDLVYQT